MEGFALENTWKELKELEEKYIHGEIDEDTFIKENVTENYFEEDKNAFLEEARSKRNKYLKTKEILDYLEEKDIETLDMLKSCICKSICVTDRFEFKTEPFDPTTGMTKWQKEAYKEVEEGIKKLKEEQMDALKSVQDRPGHYSTEDCYQSYGNLCNLISGYAASAVDHIAKGDEIYKEILYNLLDGIDRTLEEEAKKIPLPLNNDITTYTAADALEFFRKGKMIKMKRLMMNKEEN